LIPVCYGSDEEQARTTATETTESYVIHIEFCSKVKEKEREKEHTQNCVVHLDQGYIHGRKNRKKK